MVQQYDFPYHIVLFLHIQTLTDIREHKTLQLQLEYSIESSFLDFALIIENAPKVLSSALLSKPR